jgi:hypothetical protein
MGAMNANNGWHTFFGVPKTGGFLGIVTAIYTIGKKFSSWAPDPYSNFLQETWLVPSLADQHPTDTGDELECSSDLSSY